MARSATQGAFVVENAGVVKKLQGYKQRLAFELRLWTDSLKHWAFRSFYRILIILGRIPNFEAIAAERNLQT